MKTIATTTVQKQKVFSIMVLFASTILIMISGLFFSIYSLIHEISFQVLTSRIHGSFFGLLVIYLGLRYFFSVKKLKSTLYTTTNEFSWNNFRKENHTKTATKF